MHHKITKEQEKKVTIKCGWYTEKQMKEVLKMGKLDSHLLQLSHSLLEIKRMNQIYVFRADGVDRMF